MLLREIAHSRTGDKGRIVTVSVIAYREEYYDVLAARIKAGAVQEHFRGLIDGPVLRYELPNLWALNFVLTRPETQGVTRSLALDAHGKCLGSALLAMEI